MTTLQIMCFFLMAVITIVNGLAIVLYIMKRDNVANLISNFINLVCTLLFIFCLMIGAMGRVVII